MEPLELFFVILGGVIPALFFIVPLFLMARGLQNMNEGMEKKLTKTSRKPKISRLRPKKS